MSIGEFFRVKKENIRSQWESIRLYYPKNWRFGLADFLLGLASLFFNPYRVCRKRGSVYGETPPASLSRIASFCKLTPEDVWLDLGAGRGKGCFWIASFIGCRAVGIEEAPLFVWVAQWIGRISGLKRVSFLKSDWKEADFAKATCVYLYSTCMEEDELTRLTKKMEALPLGAKVVSVSAPLPKNPYLHYTGSFPLIFPWGDTEGYLHMRSDERY